MPFLFATFWGKSVVWGRYNLTRSFDTGLTGQGHGRTKLTTGCTLSSPRLLPFLAPICFAGNDVCPVARWELTPPKKKVHHFCLFFRISITPLKTNMPMENQEIQIFKWWIFQLAILVFGKVWDFGTLFWNRGLSYVYNAPGPWADGLSSSVSPLSNAGSWSGARSRHICNAPWEFAWQFGYHALFGYKWNKIGLDSFLGRVSKTHTAT